MSVPAVVTHPQRAPSALEQALLGVRFGQVHRLLPGVALAGAVVVASGFLSKALGAVVLRLQGIDPAGRPSPLSAMMLAIVLGLVVANGVKLPAVFKPGLDFGIKKGLRLGIILVGLKLSFFDVLKLGALGIPVVLTVVAVALVVTHFVARRLGVSDRLGTLAAASTAICGVTATLAVAPTIDADDREVAYTVANVTLFGMVAMFVYPWLARALFAHAPGAAGLFLGTGIHDTSQVMGAALAYREVFGDEAALKVATVSKLTRNALLAAVVPFLAWQYARRAVAAGGAAAGEEKRVSPLKLFPLFVLGFLALALVRTVGDASFGAEAAWPALTSLLGDKVSFYALGLAMAGVGLTTRLSVFKGLGLRPLYVGALAAGLVGALALGLAALVGPHIAV